MGGIMRCLIVSFVIVSSIFYSCGKKEAQAKIETPIEVTTYIVAPKPIPIDFSFVGVVQSSHQVQIRSRVEGYLKKIEYQEGKFVKEGDPLFQIDTRRFNAIVREAQANLEKEKAALWVAEQSVTRLKPLYEQEAVSKKDLDDAIALQLSQQASVNSFQAKLDEAQLDLNDALITSPIAGITSSSNFQEGSLISPNANGVLTTVSILNPIWVILNVSESYFLTSLEQIAKGELVVGEFRVKLTLSNGEIFPYEGKVSFVSPLYSQDTGTLTTRAVFENPENTLKPGQFVKAVVTGATNPNAILVPQDSVLQGADSHYVFVVDEDKRVEVRNVQVGSWYQEYWIINSGLKPGDQVVVAGVNKIKAGNLVKIIKKK